MEHNGDKSKTVKASLDAYRKTEVGTANRETLLLMLYAGALRFLKRAIEAAETNNVAERNGMITKTQEIVSELRSTLNFEVGGELARRLDSLYGFITQRLLQGQMEMSATPLREALGILETLNQAWEQAVAALKMGKPPSE